MTATRPSEPDEPSIFDRPMQRIVVEFKVHRISARQGAFTEDERIWSLLEAAPPAAVARRYLADNGFRAAVGHESDRTPLIEALDSLREERALRTAVDHIRPDVSRAIEMDLGGSRTRIAVFHHTADGRLAGGDFQEAQAKFLMTFALRSYNLREVWLDIVPAIEEPPGPLQWVGTPDGGFIQVPQQRRRVFGDIRLTTAVPEGGFLLLGPAKIVYKRPYLARPFFVQQESDGDGNAVWRESIYVISPILRFMEEKGSGRTGAAPTGGMRSGRNQGVATR